MSWLFRFVGATLVWLNLLRVPLMISAAAALLPAFAVFKFGPVALVRGAYETSPHGFAAIAVVLGFLFSSCVANTRLVFAHGLLRFGLSKKFAPPRALQVFVHGVYALAPVVTVLLCLQLRSEMPEEIQWLPEGPRVPRGSWLAYGLWGVAGFIPALVAHLLLRCSAGLSEAVPVDVSIWWHRILKRLGPGYVHGTEGAGLQIAQGHREAGVACVLSLIASAGIGAFWDSQSLPAGLYILLTLLALSWVLSGMSFYLDRYRVSLAITVGLWLSLLPNLWRTDYVYDTVPTGKMQSEVELPGAGSVLGIPNPLAAEKPNVPKYLGLKPKTVCVSAVGGGIHSGAWEVEVLTRLAEIPGCEKLPGQIRVISGTSGGAYGAMFYADGTYPPQGRPPANLDMLRAVTQTSSLSSAVKAMTYHDLFGYFLPPLWGRDRGNALEAAWARNGKVLGGDLETVTLWDWSQRVKAGQMPAVLFTSGTRESGRPIIFGTSQVADWNFNALQTHLPPEGDFPFLTTRVNTGARLSATFPWVSPAARPDAEKVRRAEHQLDGGYYDNYGIVALNSWLDEGLLEVFGPRSLEWGQRFRVAAEGKSRPPALTRGAILVIQIRYEQKVQEPPPVKTGFFFQLTAPIFGIYNSRTAGQQLRADDYFKVFSRYWTERGVQVQNAAFEFRGDPPLSWHLTQQERGEITKQGKAIGEERTLFPQELARAQAIPDEKQRNEEENRVRRKFSRGAAAELVRKFLTDGPKGE